MIRRVLFLCTANYYRSRFAEHIFNWLAEREGLRWRADSCGLAVVHWDDDDVGAISSNVVEALRSRAIPVIGDHRRPRQVTHDDLADSQLVIGIKEAEHRLLLSYQFPDWADRVEYGRMWARRMRMARGRDAGTTGRDRCVGWKWY
jgi:protein-tyrosine phosphatase